MHCYLGRLFCFLLKCFIVCHILKIPARELNYSHPFSSIICASVDTSTSPPKLLKRFEPNLVAVVLVRGNLRLLKLCRFNIYIPHKLYLWKGVGKGGGGTIFAFVCMSFHLFSLDPSWGWVGAR